MKQFGRYSDWFSKKNECVCVFLCLIEWLNVSAYLQKANLKKTEFIHEVTLRWHVRTWSFSARQKNHRAQRTKKKRDESTKRTMPMRFLSEFMRRKNMCVHVFTVPADSVRDMFAQVGISVLRSNFRQKIKSGMILLRSDRLQGCGLLSRSMVL